jgi:hypothetical protein
VRKWTSTEMPGCHEGNRRGAKSQETAIHDAASSGFDAKFAGPGCGAGTRFSRSRCPSRYDARQSAEVGDEAEFGLDHLSRRLTE